MKGAAFDIRAGSFGVHIADGRTKSPEEWGAEVADLIVHIGDEAPPGIREQAHEFKARIRQVVEANVAEAIRHERIACAAVADQFGQTALGTAIRFRR